MLDVDTSLAASASQLKKVIPTLLKGFSSVRIVIDGLDEIDDREQRQVLSDLTLFVSCPLVPGSSFKILIASRDVASISRFLSQRTVLSMADDLQAFQGAIQPFVRHQLSELRSLRSDLEIEDDVLRIIEERLVEKSNGKTDVSILSATSD